MALSQLTDITLLISVFSKRGMTGRKKEMIGWISLGTLDIILRAPFLQPSWFQTFFRRNDKISHFRAENNTFLCKMFQIIDFFNEFGSDTICKCNLHQKSSEIKPFLLFWLILDLSWPIWPFLTIFDHFWPFSAIFGHFWPFLTIYDQFRRSPRWSK